MPRTPAATLLVSTLTPSSAPRQAALAMQGAAVLFMTVLTTAAAQVSFSIPFTEIPFTMQPMVVLMAGMALGPRLGMASQILYLIAGIAGLPVFALSPTLPPGAARLLGPTGGYLLSYPFAAFITGWLAAKGFDRRYWTSALAMLAGLATIYTVGVLWLGLLSSSLGHGQALGLRAAFLAGVVPFVAADLLKIALASGILPGLWRLLGRT
jgi:biotin transport system substrate-specific component